ncbi:unnamed protein product [Rotaria socialis]|uniref:Uncharacterized protein n=1 Tax=Rotaria socialis TaxID=392032 RepID=A0A821UH57_9BILA|nr:unnamed protein product [Rotaria socialis]
MYLTRLSSILYQILNKALNYSLKKKDEKRFIYSRLELYWFTTAFMVINIKDQFYTMAKTNDFDLCKQYVMNYIQSNKKQLNHCQFELTKQEQQFQICPIKELSFEQIEHRLKELVDRERKYLSKRNSDKLIKFKDDISEKTTVDNDIHVFCYESIDYLPLNNNAKVIEIKNKCYKIIQEAKCLW